MFRTLERTAYKMIISIIFFMCVSLSHEAAGNISPEIQTLDIPHVVSKNNVNSINSASELKCICY